ncbi:hypothetical protein [Deinococcus peraridilitoris]|uniref:Uncharacterized protein n=1 Tax=Deinococcus peraridilitoris (strain DSM 19664 / LMG 22246 / CIP 109416 / KR-200) TaxID=937777 RepID=K9ZYP3_DEIPD|nr:hypothetical protein [Deinococcus peraridilitoris]AFZ66696.1 hypothetical protein Deipe_1137 [Deinococcus peraridilitoris DSM 19664]
MKPDWRHFALDFLRSFVVIFVVFTLIRYFGWLGYADSRGDLATSAAVEVIPSLGWALILTVIRIFLSRRT